MRNFPKIEFSFGLEANLKLLSVVYQSEHWLDRAFAMNKIHSTERSEILQNTEEKSKSETKVLVSEDSGFYTLLTGFKVYYDNAPSQMHYVGKLNLKLAKSLLYDNNLRAENIVEIGNFFNERNCPERLKTVNYIFAIVKAILKKPVIMVGFKDGGTTKRYEERLSKVLTCTFYKGPMIVKGKIFVVTILYAKRFQVIKNLLRVLKKVLSIRIRNLRLQLPTFEIPSF